MKLLKGLNLGAVKVLSLDVTGTILVHRLPIAETYAACAERTNFPNSPTVAELRKSFKEAYKKTLLDYPCHGSKTEGMSERQWWKVCVKRTFDLAGVKDHSDDDFERLFRRIYQQYGRPESYEVLPDAKIFLKWTEIVKHQNQIHSHDTPVKKPTKEFSLGIITNSPTRTIESTLPMLDLDKYFEVFVCDQDVAAEKPSPIVYDTFYRHFKALIPSLERHEVLHIGDNLVADYCGARASGFQALYLDRSEAGEVTHYQDWLTIPDYLGKGEDEENLKHCTVKNLVQVKAMLEGHE